LTKVLGKRGVLIYLVSIAVFAVFLGLATDWLYDLLGISLQTRLATVTNELLPNWLHLGTALLLAGLMLIFFLRGLASFLHAKVKSNPQCCS
jgi:hypothetical protein